MSAPIHCIPGDRAMPRLPVRPDLRAGIGRPRPTAPAPGCPLFSRVDGRLMPGGTRSERASQPPGGDDLTVCLRWLGELTTWEVGFVTDLRRKSRPLSMAQTVKLQQIADALRRNGMK